MSIENNKENTNPIVNRMKAFDQEYKDPLLEAFDEEEKLGASTKKSVISTKADDSSEDDGSSGEEGSGSGSEEEGSDIKFPKDNAMELL